jgi:hypothetical protein
MEGRSRMRVCGWVRVCVCESVRVRVCVSESASERERVRVCVSESESGECRVGVRERVSGEYDSNHERKKRPIAVEARFCLPLSVSTLSVSTPHSPRPLPILSLSTPTLSTLHSLLPCHVTLSLSPCFLVTSHSLFLFASLSHFEPVHRFLFFLIGF